MQGLILGARAMQLTTEMANPSMPPDILKPMN